MVRWNAENRDFVEETYFINSDSVTQAQLLFRNWFNLSLRSHGGAPNIKIRLIYTHRLLKRMSGLSIDVLMRFMSTLSEVLRRVSNLLLSNLRDHLRPTLQALQDVLSCSRLSSNRRRLTWPGRRARSSAWSCGCCSSSSSSSLLGTGSLKTKN